jgi:acyl carrier protein
MKMDRNEVIERITKVVSEQMGVDEDKVKPESIFIEDLGADSLDIVELVMAFEDEFETTIPDTELEGIRTVDAAADFIVKQSA